MRAEPGGAIAFDGDGTLWSGDIGEDLFEALLEGGRIEEVAHAALAREAEAEKLSTEGGAVAIAMRATPRARFPRSGSARS